MHELYVPPSLTRFSPRWPASESQYCEMALAYDLVAALRPPLVVDVGMGSGAVLVALCEAVADHGIDASVYGFDTAEDPATSQASAVGGPDAETGAAREALSAHVRKHHLGAFYLAGAAPSTVLSHFAPASVGLVRIDTAQASLGAEDLAEWRERLAPGGVILVSGSACASLCAHEAWAGSHRAARLHADLALSVAPREADAARDSDLVRLLFGGASLDGLSRFYLYVARHHALARATDGVSLPVLSPSATDPGASRS